MTLNRFNTTLVVYNGFIWHTNESRDMQSNLYKKTSIYKNAKHKTNRRENYAKTTKDV